MKPIFWAAVALCLLLPPMPLGAATTEHVVNDRYTVLAISGYDPVAYFTDGNALVGKPEFELRFANVVWRFRSAANRTAFADNPEVYAPRYGGYDPIAIARGVAIPGNPLVWAVVGDRLYLFYSEAARAEFDGSPDSAISSADGRWAEIQQDLSN